MAGVAIGVEVGAVGGVEVEVDRLDVVPGGGRQSVT
jgi:hypothetical protein